MAKKGVAVAQLMRRQTVREREFISTSADAIPEDVLQLGHRIMVYVTTSKQVHAQVRMELIN